MLNARVVGTGSYVPAQVVTNADLERQVQTSDRWIVERTGIRERHLAAPDEATSDLAVKAGRAALSSAGVAPDAVDLIIVATATPDMPFPSTACLVQAHLKATSAAAMDLSAACSGFLFALSVAEQYICSRTYRRVLVIGAEVMSRLVNWEDRNTCILFGDGAGAVLLAPSRTRRGILCSRLCTDGALWNLICVPGGGSAMPPSAHVLEKKLHTITMKGNETFKSAVRYLGEVAQQALETAHMTPKDVTWVIPHQANMRILHAVAERLSIDIDKMIINLDRYGNTSAASIPLAWDEAVRDGRIQPGDILLLLAFGSGLTWAASIVRW